MKLGICGKDYTLCRQDLPGMYGLCEPSKALITISETLAPAIEFEHILLHEIMHAILHETGLTCLMQERSEEAIVHGLSSSLHNLGYRLSKPLPEDLSACEER